MPLSAQAASLVAGLNERFPKLGTEVLDAGEARRLVERGYAQRKPLAVHRVADRDIAGPDGTRLPVRIYWPGGDTGSARPIVVFLHGGGWVLCSVDTHDQTCRRLAVGADAIVVSVEYRRAPEHRFPTPVHDAHAALSWAAGHAAALGGDPDRVAVAGDSAGGNLAAAACLLARDLGAPRIAAQLLLFPILDHGADTASHREYRDGHFFTSAHLRWYWAQYLADRADGDHPYASPLRADLAGLPPAHIVTAECDLLRDEAMGYAERLRAVRVAATFRCYPGLFHGFLAFEDQLDAAGPAGSETWAQFARILAGAEGAA
ncbi:alpha/beta hydrolase [Solihabitans fulvus]|uniref:Alpha/beta hydrolase n=1 Tax=Solihabitans fulvus TaxID=1892852 RepID=A0A5B2WPE4_9PSEU|nr:alpha/beta hydrolase [Solihabitans fulvus]KAA2252572.1 alpha/beta hydrolase [Solihabitans fulvus]